jgi:hypothetical protein
MPVNITISNEDTPPAAPPEPQGIKIEVVEKDEVEGKLNLRSAINGDLMIMDHKDIDIVVKPKDKKIVAFAKETLSDLVYGAESRLLEYLRKTGVLEIDSIQGGNIYGSLEGQIQEGEKSVEIALMKISEWMETEQPMIAGRTGYDEMEDEHLLEPDGEYSTELGEVPQAEEKGSINKSTLFAPYLYGRYSY